LHAIKRVRYAKKELDKLKGMLAKAEIAERTGENAIPRGKIVESYSAESSERSDIYRSRIESPDPFFFSSTSRNTNLL
jgi:hypothetical protein